MSAPPAKWSVQSKIVASEPSDVFAGGGATHLWQLFSCVMWLHLTNGTGKRLFCGTAALATALDAERLRVMPMNDD